MWRNTVVPDRPQKTIRLVCWITKATDTHSEYIILIAFPLQKWLRQRTLMLRLFVHWLCCLNTQSVVQVHRKYRKCFSDFHAAAGISKISLVKEFCGGGAWFCDSPQYDDLIERKVRSDQNVKRAGRTFRRSARKPVICTRLIKHVPAVARRTTRRRRCLHCTYAALLGWS